MQELNKGLVRRIQASGRQVEAAAKGLEEAHAALNTAHEQFDAVLMEVAALQRIARTIPDLSFEGDLPSSPSVNPQVCECAFFVPEYDGTPAALFAQPYKLIDDTRIYSSPASIRIARENPYGTGWVPDERWEASLEGHGFPAMITERVRQYLAGHPPVDEEEIQWLTPSTLHTPSVEDDKARSR